ncbi:ribonuclease E/G [Loktanella sp. F6476L]|uniref:Rne/Rng family ribonuclease n=1 Tax=Loktanella sp. F6476L TaxID=2926405 RepID=UPI001FF2E5D6|nr:ribonuclease E/G [Loktanella sp. F6476L]MCK0121483.1 ribonuclease E/G [Loktanella sp. F6476L]
MPKKMLIDATHAEETRVVVVDGNKVEEFDFESQFKRQLAGNIYLAKVTRVEPSLQAAFVDYGGNRHGFLAFSEIHPDYYQIPVADREALLAEEKAYAESLKAEAEAQDEEKPKPKRRRRSRAKASETVSDDAVATAEVASDDSSNDSGAEVAGMETIDLEEGDEGSSPMELVAETPVETPSADEDASDDAATGDADAVVALEDTPAETVEEAADDASSDDEDDAPKGKDATSKDDSIESVAEEDDTDEVRPVRKPRPKRYKIQEVVKVRQILLIQVVKEERGNKGAALTTYLSLAGRYCVLMPNTARGGGISRKITNAADRKKLKEIANSMTVPDGAGLIIRTAGSQRTKAEIKRDYEYLQRMWEQIRELTMKSIAPAKIYEEGDLIKRSIRDLYNKDIDEVIVAGDEGYKTAKTFMKMIMPSHAKNVKHYGEQLPLYARYQVETYLGGMFNPTVQLPSGGYIVIGITEALVAIDVNSGRATKEGSIEQTALKTNLEAADEVARQLRLRDLAGLIVIDFIDMDERRNNIAVEKRMKDKLKTDRARIQVGRISGFGLMEMSRQRLRPGMLEATTQMCSHCHGTGLLRSDDNVSLSILRALEEEGTRGRSKEVLVRAPIAIANFLMNGKREHIGDIEARHGMSVRIECDMSLTSPDFAIEKFKTATRVVPEAAPVVGSSVIMDDDDDLELLGMTDEDETEVTAEAETEASTEDQPKRKRRRRRRRRGGGGNADGQNGETQNAEGQTEGAIDGESKPADAPSQDAETASSDTAEAPAAEGDAEVKEKPKRTRTRRSRKKAEEPVAADAPAAEETAAAEDAPAEVATTEVATTEAASAEEPAAEEKPKPKRRSRAKKAAPVAEEAATEEVAATEEAPAAEEKPKPKRRSRAKKPAAAVAEEAPAAEAPVVSDEAPATEAPRAEAPAEPAAAEPAPAPEPSPEPAPEPTPEPVAETKADEPEKPKRKGWWSLGR